MSYFCIESSGTLGSSDIFGSADQPANEANPFSMLFDSSPLLRVE